MERIKTGIEGLDSLTNGGFVKNTINIVYGSPGVGKSIFSAQFLREGLLEGEKVFYFSLEQDVESFVKMTSSLGFKEFEQELNKNFIFTRMTGRDFKSFIAFDLPRIVSERAERHARVVIDPITPFLWQIPDKYDQREVLSNVFDSLRKLGTSVVTLERYGDITRYALDEEFAIPLYLSDTVMILAILQNQDVYQTAISIVKMRYSSHSQNLHPFEITDKGISIFTEQPVF
ncbi:MAG: ATPase domain-containing protein [Conexivisphaerales archaeon]